MVIPYHDMHSVQFALVFQTNKSSLLIVLRIALGYITSRAALEQLIYCFSLADCL